MVCWLLGTSWSNSRKIRSKSGYKRLLIGSVLHLRIFHHSWSPLAACASLYLMNSSLYLAKVCDTKSGNMSVESPLIFTGSADIFILIFGNFLFVNSYNFSPTDSLIRLSSSIRTIKLLSSVNKDGIVSSVPHQIRVANVVLYDTSSKENHSSVKCEFRAVIYAPDIIFNRIKKRQRK